MKSIEFNDNELNVLIQLIDIAVKAGGLNVAEAATAIYAKLKVPSPTTVEDAPLFAEPAELENTEEED